MKTLLQINVGLAVNGIPTHTPAAALVALRAAGFLVTRSRVDQSSTEETLIAEALPPGGWHAAAFNVAAALNQQAVAIQYPDGSGVLVGPDTAAWGGVFLPHEFLPL